MADPNVCTICWEPLDESRPYQRDIEGAGAHLECLDTVQPEEDEDDV